MTTANYHLPESVEELEKLVAAAHESRAKLRPVGSGLSPNGLGFCAAGMVNLALCDKARAARYGRGMTTRGARGLRGGCRSRPNSRTSTLTRVAAISRTGAACGPRARPRYAAGWRAA